jgi:16S rRNA (uracil1498-N3)-methyltransferase
MNIAGDIEIRGEDYHHISRVMRMNIGDRVYVCGNGQTALCVITNISDDTVFASIEKYVEASNELPVSVTIASGLPKGDKLEWIIQKGTELGASSFVPFIAARSIVKWDAKKGEKKLDRWKKIAKEAAEQSHRNKIPSISEPLSCLELIKQYEGYSHKLVAYEEEAKKGETAKLALAFKKVKAGQNLLVVFGPEGGLTEQEVALFEANGFISCGLGPRILRTETAPLYVLAAVSYHFELIG